MVWSYLFIDWFDNYNHHQCTICSALWIYGISFCITMLLFLRNAFILRYRTKALPNTLRLQKHFALRWCCNNPLPASSLLPYSKRMELLLAEQPVHSSFCRTYYKKRPATFCNTGYQPFDKEVDFAN